MKYEDYDIKKIAYHLELLSNSQEMISYPFTKMIIECGLTKIEVQEVMELLAELNQTYEEQKEEGLLDFTELLIHFAGMLNMKLHPDEAISAMKKEGYYTNLLTTFEEIRRNN